MFERFTDRARRVVVLAQDEARAINHNYIGTEHLLLACAVESEGVAGRALSLNHLKDETVRAALLRIVPEGEAKPSGHIPFTPRAKKVLELALREALQLGHNYIGTEHLLLGIVREGGGLGCRIMNETGVEPAVVRRTVIELIAGYVQTKDVSLPGWERVVPAPKPHTHIMPAPAELEEVGKGSVWRCNCGTRFAYAGSKVGPQWMELGHTDD